MSNIILLYFVAKQIAKFAINHFGTKHIVTKLFVSFHIKQIYIKAIILLTFILTLPRLAALGFVFTINIIEASSLRPPR